jgi:hypothetical protein
MITLKINGLHFPVKRHEVTDFFFLKTQLLTVFEKLTLDLESKTIIVGGFNITLSIMGKISIQMINKETEDLTILQAK